MEEKDLDIVELILNNMPTNTEIQQKIKLYMESHKSNCNYFLYEKYKKETTFFNTILKSLMVDLSSEIVTTLAEKNML